MVQQIDISSRVKPVIQADGLAFRDLNANGVLDRTRTGGRTRRSQPRPGDPDVAGGEDRVDGDQRSDDGDLPTRQGADQSDGALDEQYHRIKNDPHNTAGLPYEGTTQQITELHMRHFIMRGHRPGRPSPRG